MADITEGLSNENPPLLLPCVICLRTFRPEALAVHSKACEKSKTKHRKKFDSFKQRVKGTELAEFMPSLPTFNKKSEISSVRRQSLPNTPSSSSSSNAPATSKKLKWKEKHNELLQTIHAPATVVKPSDHERCPYCERSFGPKAYDRHLEWCREQQVRQQPKSPASQRAKERLEARTKYRAPLAAKAKRSASRDKYREPSPGPNHAPRTPTTARKSLPYNFTVTESASTPNVNRSFEQGSALRSSNRTAPSPAKKPPQTRMKFPNAVKEVVSRIANKKNNQSELEPYDLYKSAEEQMMKLLEPEKETPKPVSSPETSPTPVSPPTALSPSFTSDNSAFTKFTPIETPSSLFITEDDNANEADAKSHRSSEKSDSPLTVTYCDNRSRKDSNENPITLSTLSLCSSVSIESVDSNKNGYRMSLAANSAKVDKKTPVPLRRSVSAFESCNDTPSRKTSKGRDPAKNRLKMEDMLYGSSNVEGERYFGSESANSFLHDSGLSSSLEKPFSDLETLNSAEQELLKSMSEFEKVFCSTTSSPDQSSQPLKFPSLLSSFPIDTPNRFPDVDQQHGHSGTNGTDSAYSSLNRKSPVGGEREEGGARFCHECGTKYPLAGAKFCCQCGVRRLIL